MASDASFFTIFLFFIYTYGLGFTITSFVKNSENFLERSLMRIGIGLAVLPFLGIVLSFFKIPLDWRLFLALSIIYPAVYLAKNFKKLKFEFKPTNYHLVIGLMLLIFFFTFYMYSKGSFGYPYFEDDDPWSHAIGVKYVSVQKTVFPDKETAAHIQYISPYPPSYDLLLGILHQTSSSVMWTLKFFNSLIISMSVIFFFFFVRQFTNSKNKALYSAFVLAMLPAYLSHFIWAIALTVPLYFVGFYCAERIPEDKKWFIPAGIVAASILTISPSHSAYYGFFYALYFISKTIMERRFLSYHFFAGAIGVAMSFFFWWRVMIRTYGLDEMLSSIGVGGIGILSVGGSGDRPYMPGDFIFAKSQNLINSPDRKSVV